MSEERDLRAMEELREISQLAEWEPMGEEFAEWWCKYGAEEEPSSREGSEGMSEKTLQCWHCQGTMLDIGWIHFASRFIGSGSKPQPRFVVCRQCHAQGPEADTEEEAIALWNTRKPDPLVQAVLDAALAWHDRTTWSVDPPMNLHDAVRKWRETRG